MRAAHAKLKSTELTCLNKFPLRNVSCEHVQLQAQMWGVQPGEGHRLKHNPEDNLYTSLKLGVGHLWFVLCVGRGVGDVWFIALVENIFY